jgi:predicted secreted protein
MIVDFLTGFAVYFIIWWLVLFTVLPWGMRSAHEEGAEVEPGNDRAAPVRVNMWRKFVITTVVALLFLRLLLLAHHPQRFLAGRHSVHAGIAQGLTRHHMPGRKCGLPRVLPVAMDDQHNH